jgi:hypothetical protein
MFGAISKFTENIMTARRVEKGYEEFSTKLATCIQLLQPMVNTWADESVFIPTEDNDTFTVGENEYATIDISKTQLQIAARYLENTEHISARMGKSVEELKKNINSESLMIKIRNCVDEIQCNFSSLTDIFWQMEHVANGACDKTAAKFAEECRNQIGSMVSTLIKMRIGATSERGIIWN